MDITKSSLIIGPYTQQPNGGMKYIVKIARNIFVKSVLCCEYEFHDSQ